MASCGHTGLSCISQGTFIPRFLQHTAILMYSESNNPVYNPVHRITLPNSMWFLIAGGGDFKILYRLLPTTALRITPTVLSPMTTIEPTYKKCPFVLGISSSPFTFIHHSPFLASLAESH